jgi:ketosteroid isomerase-like protein
VSSYRCSVVVLTISVHARLTRRPARAAIFVADPDGVCPLAGQRAVAAVLALSIFAVNVEARAQDPAASSAKTLRESLFKADRALSAAVLARGITAAFGDVTAPDAILLYDGAPIVSGRANILALLDAQPMLKTTRIQWLPLVVTVSSDGSLGAAWGAVTVRAADSKSDSALRFAKYISTWRRSPAGEWQLAAYVEMRISDQKIVIPPSLAQASPPFGNPSSGSGAAFAKADIDFARMAGATGGPAAFAAFVAPDGMTMPGTGEIVVGPAAVNARMLESPAAKAKWQWHPVYSEGSDAGDLGFTVGEATIAIPDASGVTEYKSKYLTVWRRQPDGSIRFIVDGGNDR